MPWVKITDKAHENEKLQEASGDAVKLWLMALSWANSELTDGHIPLTRAPRLMYMRKPEKVIGEMLERRMWHRAAQICKECIAERIENNVTEPVPSSGYYIHGYFGSGREKYQRPRWAILADRLRLSEAGRRGGLAKPSAKQDASEEDEPEGPDGSSVLSTELSTELKPKPPLGKLGAKHDAKHTAKPGAKHGAQARTPVTPYPGSIDPVPRAREAEPPIPDVEPGHGDAARSSSQVREGLRQVGATAARIAGTARGAG